MAAGSNSIEFRVVQTIGASGQVIGQRLQVRTKDIVSSVLGVIPLSSTWSAWENVEIEVVTESG